MGSKCSIKHVKYNDLRVMLISMFRYAIGRRTYIVGYTIELIMKYKNVFNVNDWKDQFISEINRYEDMNGLGDKCDINDWLSFREFCVELDIQLNSG